MAKLKLTPTQSRIAKVLADGMPHHRTELMTALGDELGEWSTVRFHLSGIRQALRPRGEDIICQLIGKSIHYRHVRLIQPSHLS